MSHQRRSIVLFLVGMFIFTLIYTRFGNENCLGKAVLDWYAPGYTWLKVLNTHTVLRIWEAVACLASMYLMRTFPNDLRIWEEAVTIFFVSASLSWVFELYNNLTLKRGSSNQNMDYHNRCIIFGINSSMTAELIRGFVYPILLYYFTGHRKTSRVPAFLMTSFDNFIKDPECFKYFHMFAKREPRLSQSREIEVSGDPNESIVGEEDYNLMLDQFNIYRHTKSFATLKKIREEAEYTESLGYALD